MNIEYLLNTGKLVNTIHKMTYDNFGNLHNFSNWQQKKSSNRTISGQEEKLLEEVYAISH